MIQTGLPRREDIMPDTPLRLGVAAAFAFPDGTMTASGLRREAARGRLVIERIAGKDYTTLANIERMRELCRVEVKAPDCGSNLRVATRKGRLSGAPSMSSGTDRPSAALVSAKAKLNKLKGSLCRLSNRPIQRTSTPRPRSRLHQSRRRNFRLCRRCRAKTRAA